MKITLPRTMGQWAALVLATLGIISSVAVAYGALQTDNEAVAYAVADNAARNAIIAQHNRDLATIDEKADNERIERAEEEIVQIRYSLKFEALTEAEKEFKRDRKDYLLQLQSEVRLGVR